MYIALEKIVMDMYDNIWKFTLFKGKWNFYAKLMDKNLKSAREDYLLYYSLQPDDLSIVLSMQSMKMKTTWI